MEAWLDELEQIFPDGVCDYRRADQALPDGLLEALRVTMRE